MQKAVQCFRRVPRQIVSRGFTTRDPPIFDNISDDKIKKIVDREKDKSLHGKVKSRIQDAPNWDEKLGSASGNS